MTQFLNYFSRNLLLASTRLVVSSFAGAPPDGAPALFSLKTINYDLDWATDNMDRVRERWSAETGK